MFTLQSVILAYAHMKKAEPDTYTACTPKPVF